MKLLILVTILFGVTFAVPPKKALDPVKDIKFEHPPTEGALHEDKNAADEAHHSADSHSADHHDDDHHDTAHHDTDHHILDYAVHNDLQHHSTGHAKDKHDHALTHHVLAQHKHEVAQHQQEVAHRDHAFAHHLLAHHTPVFPVVTLDKHTPLLLVPLHHAAVVPVKPGGLYDPQLKKQLLFVPVAH